MKQIDWSKAPEGATHYNDDQGANRRLFSWMKNEAEIWYFYDGIEKAWKLQPGHFPNTIDVLVACPSAPWNGGGRPPVGTVCECRVKANAPWVQCKVVAHHKHYAIAYVDDDTVMLSCGIRFRPIRTPEQIAAEERLHNIRNAYTAIARTLDRFASDIPGGAAARAVIESMIDAGYRKVEQGK